MDYITDKPDWRTKVGHTMSLLDFAKFIIRSIGFLEMPGKDISDPMMDWVIEELRYKAKLFEDIGAVVVYTGHVVKSDSVVPYHLNSSYKLPWQNY